MVGVFIGVYAVYPAIRADGRFDPEHGAWKGYEFDLTNLSATVRSGSSAENGGKIGGIQNRCRHYGNGVAEGRGLTFAAVAQTQQ
jgi:hypothetical protein